MPLIRAAGPGADSMFAVGIPVFFGLIGSAVLGIFIIPLLFIVFEHMREWSRRLGGRKGDGEGSGHVTEAGAKETPPESA